MITEVMIKGFISYTVSPTGVFKPEIKLLSENQEKCGISHACSLSIPNESYCKI